MLKFEFLEVPYICDICQNLRTSARPELTHTFVIRKLHLLVLRSYMGPFIMAFSIVLFLLVMQFMALYLAEIAGKGLDATTLLQLFYYAAARLVVMAMPVSLLAAALITLGGMGENYEIAAIKSCGISLFRLSMPLIIFGLLLTGVSLYF